MSDATLTATPRTDFGSGPARRLRREGEVPAVVYGLDAGTVEVSVNAHDLGRVLAGEAGANTLISLSVAGEEQLTLARQIERHPVRGNLVHVDFIRVSRDTAVTAEVQVHLTGEARGVQDGGVMDQLLFAVTITAKPADIPNAIEVDVTDIELSGQLHVSDLPSIPGVTVEHEADELIAQIIVPRGLLEGEGEPTVEGEGEAGAAEAGEAAAAADADPESSDS